MNERLLQYIWKFRYFSRDQLYTLNQEPIEILDPGIWNSDQGPDFLNAKISIGSLIWAGNVELHLKSSDWNKHAHQNDERYQKIILHVVYQHDVDLPGNIPILCLQNSIPRSMLETYEYWLNNSQHLPCGEQLKMVPDIIWHHWLERLAIERLLAKTAAIEGLLQHNHHHWQEVFWQVFCRYLGAGINAESFFQIAKSLPLTTLQRHKTNLVQLEALLLGQGGLLHAHHQDSYPAMLYKEHQYLKQKLGLGEIHTPLSHLRLRPSNFPEIRLAQLAAMIHQSKQLFSALLEANQRKQVYELMQVRANDYWHYHFKIDHPSAYLPKKLGKQALDILLINAIIPVVYAYGKLHRKPNLQNKALQWLQETPMEKNRITGLFSSLQKTPQNAFESQAQVQLSTHYCDQRHCLDCAAGNFMLKKTMI